MKSKVALAGLAFLALTSLGFGQFTGDVFYTYPADWDCSSHSPLTYGQCFVGTPIPDGTTINIKLSPAGTTLCSFEFNPGDICGAGEHGFFVQNYACTRPTGDQVYCDIEYQGCHYWTTPHTVTQGLNDIPLIEADWNCECGAPCTPTEEGSDGPYDISMDLTKVFFSAHDSCTVWITAQGGTAHGVTVEVFDAVPEFHPVAFNYMSRIVAIYWDGSQDPATSLLVRMYYKTEELWESGFTGASCLIAARFDEFSVKWSPIIPFGSSTTEKYIEFVTDRSGYFTFDCRGTTLRGIPIGDPTVSSADKELVVRWQTMDEFENYRFHILRAEKSEGPYVEIATVNSQLPDIGTTGSYNYEYRDPGLENGRTYYYRLGSEDLHGNTVDGLATVSGVPSLYGDAVQIDEYRLHAAYPNPFNPETRITYDVRDVGRVTLCVFDILGREVARLVDREQARGRYNVTFNARDLPSGLYFYRIDIGGQFTSTQKMLLLK